VTDDDDFFDNAPAKPMYGVTDDQSYYRYPPPPGWDGVRPKPSKVNPLGLPSWRRMTNLAGAFADQRALQIWLEWKAWMGLRVGDGILFDEWMAQHVEALDVAEQKELVTQFAERARAAAGGNTAARKGTARHDMLEGYLKTGKVNGTRTMIMQMASLLKALEVHELDPLPGWSERRVWHPAAGGTMGTLDMGVMCRRTGEVGVLDLKTQGRFFTFQEIAAQQYGYDSAPWVWDGPPDDRGCWVPNYEWTLTGVEGGEFAGRRVALLAHMPLDLSPVRIIEVPLDYGAEVLACAAENVRLRSIGKSVAPGRRVGAERPLTSRTMAR
jgi:hypothetical protein